MGQGSLTVRCVFWSSCQLDLSSLAKEQTHHLELPLEENRGDLVLLVTLTATAAVSITDLSITPLDDPYERREIHKRYVSRIPHLILKNMQMFRCENPGWSSSERQAVVL